MSEVAATLASGGVALLIALAGMIWRLGTKVGGLAESVQDLKTDLRDLRQNVVENARIARTTAVETATVAKRIEDRQLNS
jgi:hypothetical protein